MTERGKTAITSHFKEIYDTQSIAKITLQEYIKSVLGLTVSGNKYLYCE